MTERTKASADLYPVRPTLLPIDLDALVANYRRLKELAAPAEVMAVLKANAYGHGLLACAKVLDKEGADCFGVALLEEGIALRKAGVQKPILVKNFCGLSTVS